MLMYPSCGYDSPGADIHPGHEDKVHKLSSLAIGGYVEGLLNYIGPSVLRRLPLVSDASVRSCTDIGIVLTNIPTAQAEDQTQNHQTHVPSYCSALIRILNMEMRSVLPALEVALTARVVIRASGVGR